MGVHIFTKVKITEGWKKKKNVFFSYFISVIPNFSYMDFSRKCSTFHQSIPLKYREIITVKSLQIKKKKEKKRRSWH